MRNIEFRGFNYCTKTWSYAALKHIIEDQKYNPIEYFKVDPDTITQNTGMKDRNGKDIFEGDIVKVYPPYESISDVVGVIEYDNSNAMFRVELKNWSYMVSASSPYQFEVIGNIFENPELLSWERPF